VTPHGRTDNRSADQAARWRLDQCVTRYSAANTRLARIYQKIDEAAEQRFTASQARDSAELALSCAREQQSTQLAAIALGEVEATSLDEAEADCDIAVANHEKARRLVAALETERTAAEKELNAARLDRDAAIAGVLQSSPAVLRLLTEYDQHRARVASLHAALQLIDSRNVIQNRFWDSVYEGPVNPDLFDKWESAIALLSEDADTPLPESE
jgi:chromosome segregation ATPase